MTFTSIRLIEKQVNDFNMEANIINLTIKTWKSVETKKLVRNMLQGNYVQQKKKKSSRQKVQHESHERKKKNLQLLQINKQRKTVSWHELNNHGVRIAILQTKREDIIGADVLAIWTLTQTNK